MFLDPSIMLKSPILASKKRKASPNAEPRAVKNPVQKPRSAERLKVRTKMGPTAEATETPTKKHFKKNQQFIINSLDNEILCIILPR